MNTSRPLMQDSIPATGQEHSLRTAFRSVKNIFTLIILFVAGIFFSVQSLAQTTVTIAAGTTTWTCPIGVYSVTVECWGGGGAGGGATGSPSAGGGGGGGSYVKNISIPVVPTTVYTVQVGTGATGSTGAGANGNDTWFNDATTVMAKGGLGGGLASSNSQTAAGALALTTGNVGATAPFSYYGGAGGTGGASGASGGGGGSSAGTGSNGNGAIGTAAGVGVTGGGAGVAGSTSSADGTDNTNLGGGGAGAHAGSNTDRNGGNGGNGQIKITYTALTFKSQLVAMNLGSTTWCPGETRNVSIQIKNIGTATWDDEAGQDINVGIKWNTNGTNWTDYHVRVDAQALAPGATGTYTFAITASNATAGPVYGTPLSAGSNNLIFDVVYEGVSWFGDNAGGVGPGNVKFTSPAQTISAVSTLSLSSAAGTDAQTKCINTAITNITYLAGGTATGASITAGALPAGVTGVYNSGTKVFTISGTPTVAGVFNYTVTTSGGTCTNPSLSGTITVAALPTLSLSSAAGTNTQTKCINNAITDITYAIGGGATGASITAGALPAGVTGSYSAGVFTISGTPTASGVFSYTVGTTGPCTNPTLTGTITVNANSTLSLSSAAGTDAQTKCISTAITNITYLAGGTATGVSITAGALPTGVTGVYNSGTKVFTISGTPTVSGVFNYTVTTAGGSCINPSLSGTITVNAVSTISLSSAAGTNAQTKCINNAITDITYAIGGGGTGASITAGALPAGVTGSYSAGVFTISGTPTASGSFSYTVTTTGPCTNPSLSGTITVNANSTLSLSSAAGTDAQTKCISTAITNITYLAGGTATGVSITAGALPTGVTGVYNSGTKVFTISGTPTVSGVFNYTVTTAGGSCINPSLSGTITVNAVSTISLSSAAGTNAQTKCINNAITDITYAIGGGGTGASITAGALPAGVTGSYSAGVFTISGTPTASGSFSYTVTTTGPCTNPSLSGTITVNANSTLSLSSAAGTDAQTKCGNTAITNITYLAGGTATGVSITAGALPTGVTGVYNSGTKVFTISGTPTVSGVFNYTVTTAGPCVNNSLSGTITVTAVATISLSSAAGTNTQSVCINNGITTITYAIGGNTTDGSITAGALPAGVTGSYDGIGTYTITGTPTASGVFNYTVTANGPCPVSLSGTITVNAVSTLSLSSAAGTDAQTKCASVAISNITYAVGGGATGASITAGALPAGVTGVYSAGVFTISGTPTASGTFNYTVTTAGPCSNLSLSGSITVIANATLTLTSAAGTPNQSACPNTSITNITYAIGGTGTGAFATGLAPGLNGVYSAGVFTISGTPTTAGSFTYSVTTSGPCANPSLGGTIIVNALPTGVNISPSAATICVGSNQALVGSASVAATTLINDNFSGTSVFTAAGSASGDRSQIFTTNTSGTNVLSVATFTNGSGNVKVATVGNSNIIFGTGSVASTLTSAALNTTGYTISTLTFKHTYAQGNSGSPSGKVEVSTNGGSSWTALATYTTTQGTSTAFASVSLNLSAYSNLPSVMIRFNFNSAILNNFANSYGWWAVDDVILNGTPVVLYSWAANTGAGINGLPANAGTPTATNTNISVNPTQTTTYTLTAQSQVTGCSNTATSTVTVNQNSTISLSSAAGTDAQTVCINNAISNITYAIGGGGTGASITAGALPAGVTGSYNAGVFTISGTPTVSGNFSYTVTATGPCGANPSLSGTINVNANSTLGLSSGAGTNTQTVCINNAITDITYAVGGDATGASITAGALPAGVTGSYNAGVFTISGTPTASGNFSYTVTTTGPCVNPSLSGTITVNANSSISLSSAAGTNGQAVCINNAVTNITYAIGGGGTGASITAGSLPTGVTGSYNAGVFTISGAPTAAGSYSYTITTTGPCINNTASGTINVTANATISLTSAAGTNVQAVCNNSAITDIVYTVGSGATGASITAGGLPAGVSGLFNAGVFTISGTATAAGVYNYTVTTTGGGCAAASLSGTITVNAPPTATITSTNVSQCINNNGSITVTVTGNGPFTYSWSGVTGSGNPATTAYPDPGNVSSITGLKIGYYNVTVSDANGCSVSVTGIHIQYAYSVYITNSGSISSACGNTGSIILYGNAGVQPYTYSIDGINYQASNTFTGLAAGPYTAYVKDASGCASTKAITVAAAPPIVVNPFPRASSSCANDGSIEIYRTGGIPPYSYSLNGINYQVSNIYTSLAAGTYTAYVKDVLGCVGQQTVTVAQGAALTVAVSKTNASTCVNDGTIQVNPSGGTAPYTYSINGGLYQPSNSFSGLAAGNYAISVKDFKGCTGSINVTISLNTINVTSYAAPATDCASSNGSIQLFRTGGVGPYTYSLDGSNYQASTTFTNLVPGTYDGYVKDSKTCIGVMFGIVVGPNNCLPPPFAGGSTTTRSASNTKGNAVKVAANSVLKISAYPNPSAASFTLVLEGNSKEKVAITVTDLLGRKVYQADAQVMQQYRFGNDLEPGIYLLQVVQGTEKQSIKLVKE